MKKSFSVLSCLMLLTAANSMAMSLGRHSGATLIGRPLDISVQAELQAQDDVVNLCLEADVFYADNKLDKSRVRVTLEKSSSAPPQASIRIRSSVLVDEPIVTLYLRVGCQLKTERRYVSLAELVSEAAPDKNTLAPFPLPLPLPFPSAAPNRPAVVRPLNSAASAMEAAIPKTASTGRRSRSETPGAAPGTNAQRAPISNQSSQTVVPAKSRLKLEPLDLVIERDPQLNVSAELLSIPAADPRERAAASALWRALSAQPQDMLRDTEKLRALENSVRGLQAQSQKPLLSIDDLNVKLQQAQTERYANALVYALAALLLAAVAGFAFLLRYRLLGRYGEPHDRPWWRKNDAYETQQEAWLDSLPPHKKYESRTNRLAPIPKSTSVDLDLDFVLHQASPESAGIGPPAAPNFVDSALFSSKDKSDFGPSATHPTRAVKAEELVDVQQQADFFVSIGQPEQAIEVLRSHIAESPETSPLVYLDLFNLYHQLQLPAAYGSLRLTFNQRFNTQVPTFELYADKSLGLESYQLALSRIEVLWPSPKVLEIIEESLFRRPDTKAEAFNLEAYRELLLLYSVAKEIISPKPNTVAATSKLDFLDRPATDVDSRPMTFLATAIQPFSASVGVNQQASQNQQVEPLMASVASLVPPVSQRPDVDIDLSELSTLGDTSDSEAASDAEFFSQFDTDAYAALPSLDFAQLTPAKGAMTEDNMIDFDIFDMSQTTPVKPKIHAS